MVLDGRKYESYGRLLKDEAAEADVRLESDGHQAVGSLRPSRKAQSPSKIWLIHVILILLYTSAFVTLRPSGKSRLPDELGTELSVQHGRSSN